ncbi:methyltransferase [Nocardioides humilatus]|uniref:methyltransferase n=1 Tax=Nocardioides humilatus TaxID=2607660 RepID=UPI00165FC9AE|nr:methyltransferase [Nocardioides humilatus]
MRKRGRKNRAELDIDIAADIAVIDARYAESRDGEPSDELVEAAFRLSLVEPRKNWANDATLAKVAYFHFAPDLEDALRNYDPHLVEISERFGYISWPRRIQEHVRGRKVLDVGCGFGGFGVGFLVAGAASYVGLDPSMDLDSTAAKDKRRRVWDDMGITPRQITETLPAIRLLQSSAEDGGLDETFDTIALHNVTEHLMDLEGSLASLTKLCHPETVVVLHHHNFYSWNGHHLPPVHAEQLDVDNERHQQVYDWRHINAAPDVPETHMFKRSLNRVRLDDFRAVVERHFDVVEWEETPSKDSSVARLTPEIVARVRATVPDITERELTINTVLVVARPQA